MSEWQLKPGPIDAIDGPVVAVVLDGVGIGPDDAGNAVRRAHTPVLDALWSRSFVPLRAHGKAVGLPSDKDMGNSEVGHNALGAGRVFDQGASLVSKAIASGAIFEGATWNWLLDGVRASGEPLHFMGLLSDGNVHSHQDHLHAMLRAAATARIPAARVHVLLDGRDVDETSAPKYIARLEAVLAEINQGSGALDYRIASGGGRMRVTMDRYEAEWDMVQRGWDTHVRGQVQRGAGQRFPDAATAVKALRDADPGVIDQYLPAFVIGDASGPVGPIRDGASVCMFNFRGDRAIEITRAFEADAGIPFDRSPRPQVRYAGMMQYDGDLKLPTRFLVEPPSIDRTLSEHLARNGVTQFACSETQKFGHVTYFWNGNRSTAFDGETTLEIPSDVVPFDQRPWMKAAEIVDATLDALRTGKHRHARINIANGDMVGHTGMFNAARMAMESVDLVLGRLLRGIEALNGVALVTADHGNCDEMIQRTKDGAFEHRADGSFKALTSHTLNPVPCSLFDPHGRAPGLRVVPDAGLANVPATIMNLLGYAAPDDYMASLLGRR
ncbi:MAG: 2,3-bisphosphoglycerate-independent phosphoglycerate mutase [Bradymonadia bacterium]|jgi:2,3-bisphosphoglycerate-independent phosphoglycerate mutase